MLALPHRNLSPLVPVFASFSEDPRLAPGSPLYPLLSLPEGEGDNSPFALVQRLFDTSIQRKSLRHVHNATQLRSIYSSIISVMHEKQAAAGRALEMLDLHGMHALHLPEPITNPQGYAWVTFVNAVIRSKLEGGLDWAHAAWYTPAAAAGSPPSNKSTAAFAPVVPSVSEQVCVCVCATLCIMCCALLLSALLPSLHLVCSAVCL